MPHKHTSPAKRAAELAKLRRRLGEISARDLFPGAAREQAQAALADAERALRAGPTPAAAGNTQRLRRADYAQRIWATRRRPWIDRLASAWLIKRFIDRSARFVWLERPRDRPPHAIGYDFDGARFSHGGNRVTYETLLASFALETDRALVRIGNIVHYLHAGGIPSAEAEGLKTVLRGARSRITDDDRLLAEAQKIFDDLYAGLQEDDAA
jgi:hypothetical protein